MGRGYESRRLRNQRLYKKFRDNKICTRCQKEKAEGDKIHCRACADIINQKQKERRRLYKVQNKSDRKI